MAEIVFEEPNLKQKLFLKDTHRYVGFGGARGGGKSWAVRYKAKLLCLKYAGIKVMIVRKTYPELTENHIEPLKTELKCGHPNKNERIASYNDSKKVMTFENGSRILFRYCDTEKDVDRFQGMEVDILFIDEATQFSEMQFKKIDACVRGANSFPKRTYLPCNPGGQGHGWVKRLFVDRIYKGNEKPEQYVFIKSLVTDNTALMKNNPEYIETLEALPPKLRKAWLEGDFNILDGQFFEEFTDDPEHYSDHRFTHVIEPFEIPKEWKIYRSYDFGYSKPFSCAWWAVDYDGVIYRILELYGCTQTENEGVKWTADKQFKEIARIEQEHRWLKGRHITGVADPAIWSQDRGESIYETACKHGIYFDKADNDRLGGWQQCHYRLAFDENGFPSFYCFKTCKAFIRTIPLLLYSATKPEDLDTAMEDHVADEFRYFCMSRPISPKQIKGNKEIGDDPLDLNKEKYKPLAYYKFGGQR